MFVIIARRFTQHDPTLTAAFIILSERKCISKLEMEFAIHKLAMKIIINFCFDKDT